MALAAAALDGGPATEIDEETIDADLRVAAHQVLENQAKSRALHARRRVDTLEGER
jgi:hypothetical protein